MNLQLAVALAAGRFLFDGPGGVPPEESLKLPTLSVLLSTFQS